MEAKATDDSLTVTFIEVCVTDDIAGTRRSMMLDSTHEVADHPFVGSVVHPTDFSSASQEAFAHALAIALIRRTRLDILNVGGSGHENWSKFPSVRETLERWGLLAPGSDRSAVFDELAVRVRKLQMKGNPVKATIDFIEKHEPDLMVFGTEGRRGLATWTDSSIAQTVARRSKTQTLFVGAGGRSFVSLKDGHMSLRRVLIPVDRTPDATQALAVATRMATAMGDPPVEITVLHVGSDVLPYFDRPEGEGWVWRDMTRQGDVDAEIVAAAEELDTDLIVMATDGRNGALDLLRGSFTERVVPRSKCPVLAVPST